MRNRSMAMVARDGKLLMELLFYRGRYFYTIPGGAVEAGETAEEAALRELKEECGLDGRMKRKLATLHKADGSTETVFEVEVPLAQEPITGYDPEEPADAQIIRNVCWMKLEDVPERDRAFLWAYGLLEMEGYVEQAVSWGDEISYPGETNASR